jgi:hypothetical protein
MLVGELQVTDVLIGSKALIWLHFSSSCMPLGCYKNEMCRRNLCIITANFFIANMYFCLIFDKRILTTLGCEFHGSWTLRISIDYQVPSHSDFNTGHLKSIEVTATYCISFV